MAADVALASIRHEGADAVRLLFALQHQLMLRIDRCLRPLRLSFAGYNILMVLLLRDSLSIAEIGDRLRVHPTSISSALDRLELEGYAIRERDSHDGRISRPALTPAGRRVALQSTLCLSNDVFQALGLPDDQVRVLLRTLRALRANAGDF